MTSFQQRRDEFGRRLRRIREDIDMTGEEFAVALGDSWKQSRVSKIETGRQTATEDDVTAWCAAAGVTDSVAADLLDEVRQLRVEQVTWRRRLRAGQRSRQEESLQTDAVATRICAVEFGVVPGLTQIWDYAYQVTAAHYGLLGVERDVKEDVSVRMARQQILYEPGKQIEILVAEAALRYPVVSPAVMVAQLDRLIAITSLPTVRFGVIPLDHQVPWVPMHGYWIKSEPLGEQVLIENLTAEHRITDPEQVAVYRKLTDGLWTAAAEADEARSILLACSKRWAEQVR